VDIAQLANGDTPRVQRHPEMRPKDCRTSKTRDFRLSLDGIGSREGASSALPELHGRKRSDEALYQ